MAHSTTTQPATSQMMLHYPGLPEDVTLPCEVQIQGISVICGDAFNPTKPHSIITNIRFGMGRYGEPNLMLIVKLRRSGKSELNTRKPASYSEFTVEWRPGVYCKGTEHNSPGYEIEDAAIASADPNDSSNSTFENSSQMQGQGLISFTSTLRGGVYRSKKNMGWDAIKGSICNVNDGYLPFVDSLLKSSILKVRISFFCDESHATAAGWISSVYGHWEQMLQLRHKPLGQYCENFRGTANLSWGMVGKENYGQHMYSQFTAVEQEELQQQIIQHGNVYSWPVTSRMFSYEPKLHVSSLEEFFIVHGVGLIRRFQEARPQCQSSEDHEYYRYSMEGLDYLCTTSEREIRGLQSALVFTPARTMTTEDLSFGNPPKHGNKRWYDKAVKELRDDLKFSRGGAYRQQFDVMDHFKAVKNKLMIVVGAGGVQKTRTLAWEALFMAVIGHKIQISSTQDHAVDGFLSVICSCQTEAVARGYSFASVINGVPCLRFRPLARRICLTLEGAEAANSQLPPTRDVSALTDDEVLQFGMLAKLMSDLATRAWILRRQDFDPQICGTFKETMDAKIRNIKAEIQQKIHADAVCGLPDNFSTAHHLALQIIKDVSLGISTSAFNDKVQSFRREIHGCNVSLFNELRDATSGLLGLALKEVSIVGVSYVNSSDAALHQFWEPSFAIHDEANQARVTDFCSLLGFKSIRAHAIVGDLKQLQPPDNLERINNEMFSTTKKSILQVLVSRGSKCLTMTTQSRGHHSLFHWPNCHYPPIALRHAPCTQADNPNRFVFRRVMSENFAHQRVTFNSQYYFVNCQRGIAVLEMHGSSLENWASATAIIRTWSRLVELGVKPPEIGIACMYSGQCKLIRRVFAEINADISGTKIGTVDSFQGCERSIMLTDFVITTYNDPALDERIRASAGKDFTDIASDPGRIHLMHGRARDGHACFGHAESLFKITPRHIEAGVSTLRSMLADALRRGLVCRDEAEDGNPRFVTGAAEHAIRDQWRMIQNFRPNESWRQMMKDEDERTEDFDHVMKIGARGVNFGTRRERFPDEPAEEAESR